jgi:DNA-3-methyladenine glycosylase
MTPDGNFPDFLDGPVEEVAERLLGCRLERILDGQRVVVRIVETEAYDQGDAASHAHGGKTARNGVMFGEAGHLYVYFTYGLHHCCNVVTGVEGHGSGVLIRAAEPVLGTGLIETRRGKSGVTATNGPGKLCQGLDIDLTMNGHDLHERPLRLLDGRLEAEEMVVRSTRIGISKAADLVRRYFIAGNSFVSRR